MWSSDGDPAIGGWSLHILHVNLILMWNKYQSYQTKPERPPSPLLDPTQSNQNPTDHGSSLGLAQPQSEFH
jgi:hypothetical protein